MIKMDEKDEIDKKRVKMARASVKPHVQAENECFVGQEMNAVLGMVFGTCLCNSVPMRPSPFAVRYKLKDVFV